MLSIGIGNLGLFSRGDTNVQEVLTNLVTLLASVWHLVMSIVLLILPWTPLLAWLAFWLFAVNWVQLRAVLLRGGWIGVLLFGFAMILIWGVIAPPPDGYHHFFGLTLSNYVGKTVYVTALLTIMLLCGSVQLSGACGSWARFPEPATQDPLVRMHEDQAHPHDSSGPPPAVALHGHH